MPATNILATDALTLINRTAHTLTVSFVHGQWAGHLVARNAKYGRNTGICDTTAKTCTVKGLLAGEEFELWMRHCTTQIYCYLDAKPLNASTKPSRKNIPALVLQ